MTAATVTPDVGRPGPPGSAARVPRAAGAAAALARGEARRMVTNPLVLLGAVLYSAMLVVSSADGAGSGYDGLVTGPTFFLGVFTYFAANLCASRPRRHDCEEHHASLPVTAVTRTTALCLAVLGPVLLAVALMAAAATWFAAGRVELPVWPSAAELAAGPLTVLGGGLLGVMVARWLPFPAAPGVVMVAVVATCFWLSEGAPARYESLSPYFVFTVYVDNGSWGGLVAGSPSWHAVYLAALCGMAVAGALLRDARRPLLPLAAGGLLTLVAVATGLAQLP